MSTLIFKNQELETGLGVRDLSAITNGLIYGTSPIPDVDIREINNTTAFLYATNNLVCTLEGGDTFGGPEVRVNGFWKMSDFSADGSEFPKYQRFETDADVVLFSPSRIVIRINDSDKETVEEAYRARGLTKPDYGMLVVVLNFVAPGSSERTEYAYVLKYTHNPLFSSPIENVPLDFSLAPSENLYRSAPYSSETFFVPTISSSFVYNFYEPQEGDFDYYNERSYKTQKIRDIPKYIRLTWNRPSFDRLAWERENTPILIGPWMTGAIGGAITNLFGTGSASGSAATGGLGFTYQLSPESLPRLYGGTETDERSESDTAIRIGGVIISTELVEELATAMGGGTRTSEEAGGVFDGQLRRNTSVADGMAQIDTSTGPVADLIDEELENGYIDSFMTLPPEVEMSIAKNSDYVGYVIEKGRLTEDGEYQVVDLIAIAGKDTMEYLDTKIAYGETYRYRIRSIFRFVNKHFLSMIGDLDSVVTREQSIQFVDQNMLIQVNKTYYYDSVYSDVTEVQATEDVRPNVPVNVRLFPNSREKFIFVTWNQKNQNRDVVGFNVYRKTLRSQAEPFSRLNGDPLDVRNNSLFDYDIDPDVDYIYAIESVDFHGNFSPLSAQYYAGIQEVIADQPVIERLQKFYDIEGRELGETRPPSGQNIIIFKHGFVMNVNPLFRNTDENNTFVIRVTSLDTGIKKEIKVNFRTQTIYHVAPYVPAERRQFTAIPGILGFLDPETLAEILDT